MGGGRGIVAPGELGPRRQPQAPRHRGHEIAALEVEHRAGEAGVAPGLVMHVIAALDEERQAEAEAPRELVGPRPERDHHVAGREAPESVVTIQPAPEGSRLSASPRSMRPPRFTNSAA